MNRKAWTDRTSIKYHKIYRDSRESLNIRLFCGRFVRQTASELVKFYRRYDKNIFAYFLLGHGTRILTEHDLEVLQANVGTLFRAVKYYNCVVKHIFRNINARIMNDSRRLSMALYKK